MNYSHLEISERAAIHHLIVAGFSNREIGRRLGRHHTTIGREKRRNGSRYPDMAPYWHVTAQKRAEERFNIARLHRRASHTQLVQRVRRDLEKRWSPEQIAQRLPIDFPDNMAMRISAETIYMWAYQDRRDGGQLHLCLRRAHPKRRRQGRYGSGRGRFPGRVGIEKRPEIVNERNRFGDWEADTVEGAKGTGGIATHVERKSRYLVTAKLDDGKANTFAKQTIHAFRSIPKAWRQTLTADNGKEFAAFKSIENKTGLTVFFANPYSAWQRGTNENTNGLLRQFFPKRTDFRNISEEQLAKATRMINHRPRKCLGYRTPHEVLQKAKLGALPT